MFKWLFHILIFATNMGSGKYQNKEKPLKRRRKRYGSWDWLFPISMGLSTALICAIWLTV